MTARVVLFGVLVGSCSCVPPNDADTGGRSKSGEGKDSGDTGEQTARTCPDEPWIDVQVSWDSACGLHEGGCIECWGRNENGGWGLYDPPDLVAASMTIAEVSYEDTVEDGTYPGGCAITPEGDMECWGAGDYGSTHPTSDVAAVELSDYGAIGVLTLNGELFLTSHGKYSHLPVPDLTGPFGVGNYRVAGVTGGRLLSWKGQGGSEELELVADFGLVADWRWLRHLGELHMVGARLDGALVIFEASQYHGDAVEIAPPGSEWVDLFAYPYIVQDADGYLFWLEDVAAGPVVPDPMMRFDMRQGGDGCGVTFDGRVQCIGPFAAEYPPPGSYVVGP